MAVPIKTLHLPRPSSSYPGSYPLHFEKHIAEYLDNWNYLHLFSGSAKLGYRIDINPDTNPNLVADATHLPFEDESWDAIMLDVPYDVRAGLKTKDLYKTPKYKEGDLIKEVMRVAKPHAKIGYFHYFPLVFPGCKASLYVTVIMRVRQFLRILTVMEKQ